MWSAGCKHCRCFAVLSQYLGRQTFYVKFRQLCRRTICCDCTLFIVCLAVNSFCLREFNWWQKSLTIWRRSIMYLSGRDQLTVAFISFRMSWLLMILQTYHRRKRKDWVIHCKLSLQHDACARPWSSCFQGSDSNWRNCAASMGELYTS